VAGFAFVADGQAAAEMNKLRTALDGAGVLCLEIDKKGVV
jgi:hypothetical protein